MTPADLVLYGTIWLGLLLFVVGQLGQRTIAGGGNTCACMPWLWFGGAILCAIHMMLALGLRHGWSHQSSVEVTVAQTAAVYGVHWGAGIYFNYLFVAVWLAESAWWCINPKSFVSRPPVVASMARAFGLLWAWRPGAARGGVVRARST